MSFSLPVFGVVPYSHDGKHTSLVGLQTGKTVHNTQLLFVVINYCAFMLTNSKSMSRNELVYVVCVCVCVVCSVCVCVSVVCVCVLSGSRQIIVEHLSK